MFYFSKHSAVDLAGIYRRAENLYAHLPWIKRRRRLRRAARALRIFVYVSAAAALLLTIAGATAGATAYRVYVELKAGKNNIEAAVAAFRAERFDESMVKASQAEVNFSQARARVEDLSSSFFPGKMPLIGREAENAGYLIAAAEIMSRALGEGSRFGGNLKDLLSGDKNLSFETFSAEEKGRILEYLYRAGPELNGLRGTVVLAHEQLAQVRTGGWLRPFSQEINDLDGWLAMADEALSRFVPLSKVVPLLAGYPEEAAFLVVLQNSDELRPTGGFIGTFGVATVKNGDIGTFETHDVYHLDMPVEKESNITPPRPLAEHLGVQSWFLRDANWSPDWPETAARITQFYAQEIELLKKVRGTESKNDPVLSTAPAGPWTGVIGLTPKFFQDLLRVTGPLLIEGTVYTNENFTDLLEYRVEKGYIELGVPSWQRKEVIGRIAKELKVRIFNLPAERWPEIISVIIENTRQKNILLYLSDQPAMDYIVSAGLAGEMRSAPYDYVYVVDANMAALKTDAVMRKSISYTVEDGPEEMVAEIKVHYSHTGGIDWRTTRYRSYTRVYVPADSRLIKAIGFSGPVETGAEYGRTFFSGLIEIEPGEIGTLALYYRLPDSVRQAVRGGQYDLLVQKQPGADIAALSVTGRFLLPISSYAPAGFFAGKTSPGEIQWETDFFHDRQFTINF